MSAMEQDNGVFPRIRAGASLKPLLTVEIDWDIAGFPPHSCGGLIEAAVSIGADLHIATFSPAFVRGPH